MADERFAEHLERPGGRGIEGAAAAHVGAAGGAPCGDLVTLGIALEDGRVASARFEAAGCGALIAAASAAVTLTEGEDVLDAARVGAQGISAELGGLSPGKLHAADLVSDALHRALGSAVRAAPPRRLVHDRTLVAMSGGVDSAVAALLCARSTANAGAPESAPLDAPSTESVAAVTLELWRDPANDAESSCCSASAVGSARALAHRLGLPHFTLDLRAEFRAGVVEPYLADHAAGLTPNPCVRCNGHVRLDAMLDFAERLGASNLATGHYARTRDGLLRLAADPAKDQTYMLAALAPRTLARLHFPLGELTKPQVRALAREHALPVADKRDSQDLCFLAGTGRAAFLARHANLRERPGDIVDRAGRRVGRHRGHHGFTVGQRRGIGVAGPEPLYVLATDADANTVTVGPRDQLATQTVRVRDASVHATPDAVRLRYHTEAVPCRLEDDLLHLDEPFDGAAPGQTAVFLAGDAVVGCATITAR
ncbi:MAG: tRNA 2-thiouridine(34) synthase MnmA [Actinomycetota bacterium]|nr:tRNA 2-thiouridine(34) synthase MnmA [Actinomycetota bacterium]